MIKYHIPCSVKIPLHQTSFPANNKALFQVLEFALLAGIFFETKNLWKPRLQIEPPLLWRQQFSVPTVNFLLFW
jgi:hypothetical protein